jgi:DNA-binding transcriptional regulator PaaX
MVKKSNISKGILKKLAGKQAVPFENLQNETTEKKEKYAITRSIKNLMTDGLVESFNTEYNQYFRLTNEGKHKLNQISLESESSLVSTKWDGYWRIIILDLTEERKSEREALRYLLKKAGFLCLKNSVWISMYPFEHLFTNIKKDLILSSEMMIIVTDKIDKETEKEFLSICGINKTE